MGFFKKGQQKQEPDRTYRSGSDDAQQVTVWRDRSGLHHEQEPVPVSDQISYGDFCVHMFWEVYRRLYRRKRDPWTAPLPEVRETLMWMSPLAVCHDLEPAQADKWVQRLLSELAIRWPAFVLDAKFYN